MYREMIAEDLDEAQFKAARLGFFGVLRRKGMTDLADREGEDLFAQACFEYSRQRAEGKVIHNPVSWIVTCGWHRTVGMLEARDRRPQTISTERLGELGGEEEKGTPEEEFLSEDRHRKVRDAVDRLPDYQRRLLALSYFEGESVREAARRLGWTASKGQRAHETARRRLKKFLGVEWSDELAIEVGLAAFLSVGGGGCERRGQLIGAVEGALDALTHPADIGHRLLDLASAPFAHGGGRPGAGEVGLHNLQGLQPHPGGVLGRAGHRLSDLGRRAFTSGAAETGAAAAGGGGQAVEVCKAIAAACVIGGGAVTGALIVGGADERPARPAATHHHNAAVRQPRRQGPPKEVLAQGKVTVTPATEPTEASPPTVPRTEHPTERHHRQAQVRQTAEPEVAKAKPPPEEPEGEFEPSPEAPPPEPAPEPVAEPQSAVTETAKTTESAPSTSGGGAKPKAVPAGSPGEFEP